MGISQAPGRDNVRLVLGAAAVTSATYLVIRAWGLDLPLPTWPGGGGDTTDVVRYSPRPLLTRTSRSFVRIREDAPPAGAATRSARREHTRPARRHAGAVPSADRSPSEQPRLPDAPRPAPQAPAAPTAPRTEPPAAPPSPAPPPPQPPVLEPPALPDPGLQPPPPPELPELPSTPPLPPLPDLPLP